MTHDFHVLIINRIENIRIVVRSSSSDETQAVYSVISKTLHPEYKQISKRTGAMTPNDVALLKVSSSMVNSTDKRNTGTVKMHKGSSRYPHSDLSIVDLDVDGAMDLTCVRTAPTYECSIEWIDSATCLRIARFYPPPHPQREMCARYSGCTLYQSDVGSSAVYHKNNDTIQLGVLSRIVTTLEGDDKPIGIFSLTPTYQRWIRRTVRRI